MGQLNDVLRQFLVAHFDSGDFEPAWGNGDATYAFILEDDEQDRTLNCLAIASEDLQQLLFYSIFPETAESDHLAEVMMFVTKANYGMQVGNFELDLDDGEVRFKTSVDVEGVEVGNQLIENLVAMNFSTMNTYYGGLAEVVAGKSTAAAAIAKVEADVDDEDDDD